MSREQRDDLEQRDIALARVLAEALKQRQAAATAAATSGETCPEAELLAAYAEHALDENETARWENHFVECNRCRTILSVLTASADEPLAAQEVRDLGALVGTATLPGARAQKNRRPSTHFPARWSWLVPTMGLAAALALFFVLRPPRFAPAAPELAMNRLAGKTSDLQSGSAPTKKEEPQPDRQIAQTYIPTAPTSAARNETPSREAATPDREGAPPRRDTSGGGRAENKAKEENSEPSSRSSPPAQPELDAAGASERRVLQSEAAQVNGPAAGANSPAVAAPAPGPFASAAQAKSVAPAAPLAPSDGTAPDRKALELRSQAQALSTSVARAGIFTSPDGKVSWRVSASGRIERSSDGGRNWLLQPSGVSSDLLAGVATSEQTAWVVGRAGVILRTADGSTWQRIPSPAIAGGQPDALRGTATVAGALKRTVTDHDWISVQATDALHATVVSSDAQRFHTDDGGRTWTRQP
jgi:hypothetical protein